MGLGKWPKSPWPISFSLLASQFGLGVAYIMDAYGWVEKLLQATNFLDHFVYKIRVPSLLKFIFMILKLIFFLIMYESRNGIHGYRKFHMLVFLHCLVARLSKFEYL